MSRDNSQMDPVRDPEVARLLEAAGKPAASPSAPTEDELRARILVAAEGRLATRARQRTAWWAPLAAWTRPALPIGAAACLALVVGLLVLEAPRREETAEPPLVETPTSAAESWAADFGSAEADDPAADLLAAQSGSDFLTAVLEYPLDAGSGMQR